MGQKLQLIALFLALFASTSCGKPEKKVVTTEDGSPLLIGDIAVATQCPFGTINPPTPRGFRLKACKIAVPQLFLQNAPGPLYFSGDCVKKILAVRTVDASVDTLWQIPPDGSFSLLIDGFSGSFASDAVGSSSCLSKMTLEIEGKMECQSRDAFRISLEKMRFWVSSPTQREMPSPEAVACALPDTCHLEASGELQQCW